MSKKIALSGEGWAMVRDASEVTVRLRRPVEAEMFSVGKKYLPTLENGKERDASQVAPELDAQALADFDELNDLLIVARVASWSFDTPVSKDALLDLTDADYKILQEVSADGITDFMPNFAPSNEKDSPTNPS